MKLYYTANSPYARRARLAARASGLGVEEVDVAPLDSPSNPLRGKGPGVKVPGLETDGPTAIVRELHVYGAEVPLSAQEDHAAQHRGIGKWLIREAERVAKAEFGARQMLVLSGVGAREYYRREFGYELKGSYMVRELD